MSDDPRLHKACIFQALRLCLTEMGMGKYLDESLRASVVDQWARVLTDAVLGALADDK